MGIKIEASRRQWVRFAIWGVLTLALIVWTGQYGWLFVLPILFDFFITKRVRWLFWHNPKREKQSQLVEWVDAILFAVVAATLIRLLFFAAFTIPTGSMERSLRIGDYLFVSKLAYGPKLPQTPLTLPFTHNTLPLGIKGRSYSTLLQRDYDRRPGLGRIQRYDVVVFQFPEGDTILRDYPDRNYYALCREMGRARVHEAFELEVRPADKAENYIKRCVGLPGDTVRIVNNVLYVNGEAAPEFEGQQLLYTVQTNGTAINPMLLDKHEVSRSDRHFNPNNGQYELPLTRKIAEELRGLSNVVSIQEYQGMPVEMASMHIFPHQPGLGWTEANFGPLWVPRRGDSVLLDSVNLPRYERAIRVYEGHSLERQGSVVLVDGKPRTHYVFEMDYYFMLGDNRHNSLDGRFWGFVPEDRIEGKAMYIWLSLNPEESFPLNIRWSRIFNRIR